MLKTVCLFLVYGIIILMLGMLDIDIVMMTEQRIIEILT